MRKGVLVAVALLVAVLVAAPAANAMDGDTRDRVVDVTPTILSAEQPSVEKMTLTPVQVEHRAPAEEAAAAQFAERGSFWWIVGVIVVAGVILALVV